MNTNYVTGLRARYCSKASNVKFMFKVERVRESLIELLILKVSASISPGVSAPEKRYLNVKRVKKVKMLFAQSC